MGDADPTPPTPAAGAADELRLFELDDQSPRPSAPPTVARPSMNQTAPQPSHPQTSTRPSLPQTHSRNDNDAGVPNADALAGLRRAANAAAQANGTLDEAVAAARRAGHSWRTIATSTGIPFQTLHQRAHRPNRRRQPPEPNGG